MGGPRPQDQRDPLTGLCTNHRGARNQRRGIHSPLNRQEAGGHGSLPSRLLVLPLPPEFPQHHEISPSSPGLLLTVASKSSVLFRRWSKFSPRAKILSTFWVMIFLTPSTSLCRFLTRSFPAPPLASSWMSIQGLIRPNSRGSKRPDEAGRTGVDFSHF